MIIAQNIGRWAKVAFFALAVSSLSSFAQDLRYIEYDTDLTPPEEFRARREKLMQEMGAGSIAVFFSAPRLLRNGDVEYQYRQDNDFLYLTGFPEPEAVLVLASDGISVAEEKDSGQTVSVREILFVQPRNPRREMWEGRRYGPEGAMALRGIACAFPLSEFRDTFRRAFYGGRPDVLYLPPEALKAKGEMAEPAAVLENTVARLKSGNELTELRDPTALVRRLRAVKSAEEIRLVERAAHISATAHREAMKSCAPGMHEYELQAVYEYVYRRMGAEYAAYPCIVGAAENSVVLHYDRVRRMIHDGDIVLADCGAEYHGYAADITRTFPANGRFSPAQRRIYELVLKAEQEAIRSMKPGILWSDVTSAAQRVLEDGLYALGLIAVKDGKAVRRLTLHGFGHPVGLDVHDVGLPRLEEGMVMTIEPGVYIPEGMPGIPSEYANTGIRIEDTVLITSDGAKVLSEEVPRRPDEIERLMKEEGVGNTEFR